MKRPKLKSSHTKPLQKKPDAGSLRRKQMEKILAVWEKFPSQRLGQMLVNASWTSPKDIFYMTDEELVQLLVEYANKHSTPASQGESIINERNFPRECC